MADIKRELAHPIRNFAASAYIQFMNKPPSAEKAAILERRRLAAEDGSKALQEVVERAIAIRKNMARLRALRLANIEIGQGGQGNRYRRPSHIGQS